MSVKVAQISCKKFFFHSERASAAKNIYKRRPPMKIERFYPFITEFVSRTGCDRLWSSHNGTLHGAQ
jgi:hypothetical protein